MNNQHVNGFHRFNSEIKDDQSLASKHSQIPLPKYSSCGRIAPFDVTSPRTQQLPPNSVTQMNNENKWKLKYEDAERRRKSLISSFEKRTREYSSLEKQFQKLKDDNSEIKKQLGTKKEELNHLSTVSKEVYGEYEKLRNKYEVETGAMHQAMKSASQWYTQNRLLKRQSAALVQKVLQVSPQEIESLLDGTEDVTDSNELESLCCTVKQLSQDVARLQADLNASRLQEFESTEQVINLSAELDQEREARLRAETELNELQAMKENLGHVTRLVAGEMTALREKCQQEKEIALRMKNEADKAQRERNVLAHQSSLLMADVGDERSLQLLFEIENLKRLLEEERLKHEREIQELQEKLEERESEAQLELMEEKLKLAESELQCALQRAERAEIHTGQLGKKDVSSFSVENLEMELAKKSIPPPPPLPPPLPLSATGSFVASPYKKNNNNNNKTNNNNNINHETENNPVLEMASILGISSRKPSVHIPATGAIDDIINQIKGGRFTLKATEKHHKQKKEETPPAMQEMLSILGTLKKKSKLPNKPCSVITEESNCVGDVAL